ncbi:PEP-CTERM sorting domain-containing protein [Pseudoduganella armeniaca]|nr:PEP-CTERM sorting domain-containing protein [Pseudoduganella armeniaca]
MLRRLFCTALLAASACAQAQETTWHFTYQGFINAETGVFDATRSLTGEFRGNDANADGIVALDEITDLTVGDLTYLSPSGGCVASTSPYLSCRVYGFSYTRTGELDVGVSYSGNDEFFTGWYGSVRTGDRITTGRYSDIESVESNYLWSDRTTFTISPAPVPEPGTLPMAMAGLALVAVVARRMKVAL